MNDEMKFAGLGAYLYGALYLVGVFVAALVLGNAGAALWAIAGAAAAYISQIITAFRIAGAVGGGPASIVWLIAGVIGAIAGLSLIAGA